MRTMIFSALLLAMTSTPSIAGGGQPLANEIANEARERELAFQLAPIKSDVDLRAFLSHNRAVDSPLNLLSPGARKRFLQSLVFTEKGLASFDYRDIQTELTATQAYHLLSLFGAQRSTAAITGLRTATPTDITIMWGGGDDQFTDYHDYACAPPATCIRHVGAICIGDNC